MRWHTVECPAYFYAGLEGGVVSLRIKNEVVSNPDITSLFIIRNGDCLTSPATSASSVFLVMTMIIAATTFMITIYTAFAFFIFAATFAFRAVCIAFTLAAGSLRNSILFSLFPFLFCPLVQTGSHSRLKKRGHKSIRFSS